MAEELAEGHMRHLGFTDARRTARGADGGVDVIAADAVAQVKNLNVPVGAPDVQRLRGAAHGERFALFYSGSGYSRAAFEFATAAGVALFEYDATNQVHPVNAAAEQLATKGFDSAGDDVVDIDASGILIDGKKLSEVLGQLDVAYARGELWDAIWAIQDEGERVAWTCRGLARDIDAKAGADNGFESSASCAEFRRLESTEDEDLQERWSDEVDYEEQSTVEQVQGLLDRQHALRERYAELGGFDLADYPVLDDLVLSMDAYGRKPAESDAQMEELEKVSDESLILSLAYLALVGGVRLAAKKDARFAASGLYGQYRDLIDRFDDEDDDNLGADITVESLTRDIARDHQRRAQIAELLGIELANYPLITNDRKALDAAQNPVPARIGAAYA